MVITQCKELYKNKIITGILKLKLEVNAVKFNILQLSQVTLSGKSRIKLWLQMIK